MGPRSLSKTFLRWWNWQVAGRFISISWGKEKYYSFKFPSVNALRKGNSEVYSQEEFCLKSSLAKENLEINHSIYITICESTSFFLFTITYLYLFFTWYYMTFFSNSYLYNLLCDKQNSDPLCSLFHWILTTSSLNLTIYLWKKFIGLISKGAGIWTKVCPAPNNSSLHYLSKTSLKM